LLNSIIYFLMSCGLMAQDLLTTPTGRLEEGEGGVPNPVMDQDLAMFPEPVEKPAEPAKPVVSCGWEKCGWVGGWREVMGRFGEVD
jgi:hypothetical protein